MKKNKIKGLSAFELLGDLDDEMILAATLPEEVPAVTPAIKKRSPFLTFMNSGWAAVVAVTVVAVTVSLGVLTGLVLVGRMAGVFPPISEHPHDTEPGQTQSRPDIQSGILYPPLSDDPDSAKVTVISDGICVYPNSYFSCEEANYHNEQGELIQHCADGLGAYGQLKQVLEEAPELYTGGHSFSVTLASHERFSGPSVYRVEDIQNGDSQKISLDTSDTEDSMMGLATLPAGSYLVVFSVHYEYLYSNDEYLRGTTDYAFRLTVDPTMNQNAPVRVLHGDKTYLPAGYTLQKIYYDAELKQEVTKEYDGAEKILSELAPDMMTATVARGESLGLYLAPFYELKWVRVFDSSLRRLYEMGHDSPLDTFSETEEAGDYYVIITAVYLGTGEAEITEFPLHIKLVEEVTQPDDYTPRVTMRTDFGILQFGSGSTFHPGYMLWTEQWHDGDMVSGDGLGAEGQLAEIASDLPSVYQTAGATGTLTLSYTKDTLTHVTVYDNDLQPFAEGADLATLKNLPLGTYVVILRVETQGEYIPEAKAFEKTCTEYAFWLRAEYSASVY